MSGDDNFLRPSWWAMCCATAVMALLFFCAFVFLNPSFFIDGGKEQKRNANILKQESNSNPSIWKAPDTLSIQNTKEGKSILYGRELIRHTSVYLGPNGKVASITNGMNCQNCHLNAGTKFFGNNYSAVASNYPKFRDRSGTIESIEKRVNDCVERSLNGKALADDSKEMKALVAYIAWVGKDVSKKETPKGAGIEKPRLIDRPADSVKGKIIYQSTCSRCHGTRGEGLMSNNGLEWKYPPLWGENSFNIGAGLYRLSRLAGYVKANMPNDGATYDKPVLTDEEAWDVAAYIVSMPRPHKNISQDWPDISSKPFDHPFGPYTDGFTETQHKYGPFAAIVKKQKK